jgi:hypothetical protein
MEKVTAEAPKVQRSIEVEYEFGANLDEAKALFGEAAVFSIFQAKAEIIIQDICRRMLVAGKTDEEIKTYIAGYKLGVQQRRAGGGSRKTAEQKLLEEIQQGKMDQNDLKALITKLSGALQDKKKAEK